MHITGNSVGRNCDLVSTFAPSVRCVVDAADVSPFWVAEEECKETRKANAMEGMNLWGRRDNEECLAQNEGKFGGAELAQECGEFARYFATNWTPLKHSLYIVCLVQLVMEHAVHTQSL